MQFENKSFDSALRRRFYYSVRRRKELRLQKVILIFVS